MGEHALGWHSDQLPDEPYDVGNVPIFQEKVSRIFVVTWPTLVAA